MSAFGVEHTVSKRKRNAADTAIVGAGGVVAGTGLAAGGVPGMRSDPSAMKNTNSSRMRRALRSDPHGNASAVKLLPGGVTGYRVEAHKEANRHFISEEAKHANDKGLSRTQHFLRARGSGKIAPEEEVMRHLKTGRKAAGAALLTGGAAVGYGLLRDRKKINKRDDRLKQASGALAGTGAATFGVAHGVGHGLESQGKKWEAKAKASIAEAEKITPGLRGPTGDHARITRKTFRGTSNKRAAESGMLHGRAAQERYFGRAYAQNAKMVRRLRAPGLAVAATGVAGLALAEKRKR